MYMFQKIKKSSAVVTKSDAWHDFVAWCRKHYLALFIWGTIIIFIAVLVIIYVLSQIEQSPNTLASFSDSADYWIALLGAALSYAGTCFIGIIAMWQNKKLSVVNDKLLQIEELRITPKFKCKPGTLTSPENRKTDSYIIIEHISGECAYDLKIENFELSINGVKVSSFPKEQKIPSQIYIEHHLYHRFSLPFVLNPDDELLATLTLHYRDSFGKTYQPSFTVPWKSPRAFADDQNRSSKTNALSTEKIPVCATSQTGPTI